jgi:tRNA A-37 threonylcarbamoyl transferase component Bud32
MRRVGLAACLMLMSFMAATGQKYPFLPMSAPGAPQGVVFPFIDSKQRLWLAGAQSGGILLFDGSRYLPATKDPVALGAIRGMNEDSEGVIWLASSQGIYRLKDGVATKIVEGAALDGIARVAPDVFIASVHSSASGGAVNAVRISRSPVGWQTETILPSILPARFTPDHDGNILFACAGGYCEARADRIAQWRPGTPLDVTRHAIPANSIAPASSQVLRDRFGCVWMRNGGGAWYQCPDDPRPVVLPAETVNLGFPQVLEMADGTMVLPSYGALAIGRPGKFRLYLPLNGYPTGSAIAAGSDDSLWIGSTHGLVLFPTHLGMEFWNAEQGLNGTVWSLLHRGREMLVSADMVRVLDADHSRWQPLASPKGRIVPGPDGTFLVTSGSGIDQVDASGRVLRQSPFAQVWEIAQTSDGAYWAGGVGIYKISFGSNRIDLQPVAAPGAMPSVQAIQPDRSGSLWACGSFSFAHIDSVSLQIAPIHKDSLSRRCDSLAVDTGGNLWSGGTQPQTLTFIGNPASANPAVITFPGGGEVGVAGGDFIASDRRGWLWRGAADGTYVADPGQARAGRWLHLSSTDGLPALDGNQGSFFEDADGSIWFGAENSVIHIRPPDDLVHPRRAPSIFVSAFSFPGSTLQMADWTDRIESGADITAHIGSLQFDRRNALHLSYRLRPGQSNWTPASTFDLHLGRLRSGTHTLEIRAQLGDGPWSSAVEKSFVVLLPFWLTWPAFVAYAAIALAAVWGFVTWRKRRQLRRDMILPDLSAWRMNALAPETQSLVGTVLDGRYEIGEVIAIGGLATVVKAHNLEQQNSLCVVKVFRQEVADPAWVLHRFHQEVTALESLSHPGIVRITDHGALASGSPYLVMEHIEGRTLRDRLANQGRLPARLAASYLAQIVSALGALHRRTIYHRDLKPENLMIRNHGSDAHRLVLIDFSIALVKSPEQTFHGISRVMGTLEYMAPEQLTGYADNSTDIHSLAKVLIEMLNGTRCSELMQWATLDMPGQVRRYFSANPHGLSGESVEMIASALCFDPAHRPRDVEIFSRPILRDLGSSG